MSQWQNPNSDLGQPLTRPQQLQADSNPAGIRYFWLTFSELDEQHCKTTLAQLMQQHQVLTSYYAIPPEFDVLRSQLQTPRLDFRVYQDCEQDGRAYEAQAALVFAEQAPHLLAWLWPQAQGVKMLLAASNLTLDDYSADKIYQLLNDETLSVETPEIQYTEFAEWINELNADEDAEEGFDYWQSLKLEDLPEAKLNEAKSLSTQNLAEIPQSMGIAARIPQALQQQLNSHSQALNSSAEQLVLNVWTVMLAKLSGNTDLKVHYFHDCRNDYEEFEDNLGLFAQPLTLPCFGLDSIDLTTATQATSAMLEEMLEYQEYVQVIDGDTKTARHAGFYWHQQNQLAQMASDGFSSDCPLLLHYIKTEQGDSALTIKFDTRYYDESAMNRLLARLQILLLAAVENPNQPMNNLPCLLADEKPQKVTVQKIERNFVSLFAEQAKAWPHEPALIDSHNLYSYESLDSHSERYAGALQKAGAKRETIVAMCLPRSAEQLICLLAIVKTGAAYLPLDPGQPQVRLQQILDDAQPVVLVSDQTELVVDQRLSLTDLQQFDGEFQAVGIALDQLAYVLYTSGSTGKPKGVQVEHRQLIHYSQAAAKQLDLPPHGHYGLISTLVADLGNTMLFPAWLNAGCVHLLGQEETNDGLALSRYCQNAPLDCLKIVPSHLEALLSAGDAQLLPSKVLVLGGEPISSTLVAQLKQNAPQCRIYNHYGPTETTVGVMFSQIDLSVGNTRLTNTLGDTQILLLDVHKQPVVSGQQGELHVAGSSVSRGYLGNTEKTNEVYLDNPFDDKSRMYATGDLALRHADGSIEILGRSDHQVKIRGFRLELDEIQVLLNAHPGVSQANLQIQGSGENAKLLAFVVLAKGAACEPQALADYLAQRLPHYMVPAHIYQLQQLPLNANGKVDRQALFAWAEQQQLQQFVAPRNGTEQTISEIWQEILQLGKVSVLEDFFALGGHSLAAIKVIAKIRTRLGIELPNDLLFHHKTVAHVAQYLEQQGGNNDALRLLPLAQADSEQTMVLMHAHAGHYHYHQQLLDNLQGKIEVFGLTANPSIWSSTPMNQIDTIIADHAEQLSPLKHKPLLLCGWSLGGKFMVLLAEHLLAKGFNVQSVSVIDYDPAQKLTVSDDAKQLLSDFRDYVEAESLEFDEQHLTQIEQSFSTNIQTNYQQAMRQLLRHPAVKNSIGNDVSEDELQQRFIMRWHIKQHLYNSDMPILELPLWIWHGNQHASPADVWQAQSTQPIHSSFIDADHYQILNHPALAKQLIQKLKALSHEKQGETPA